MGGDLKYWLSQHKCFGFEASRYYAARTLLGLKALHDRDFVYRDVKPENMLVDEHGRVRLSDLGLACRVHSELKGASGTPGYMAPEMLRREVYDHRVDYFSLGCMVVEFVVGVCPFRTRDAAHWGGRKKKKKKKKEGVDRALLKQAKKEDARASVGVEIRPPSALDSLADFHTGEHGAGGPGDGAGLDPGRLEGGSRSRREGVLQGLVAYCVEINAPSSRCSCGDVASMAWGFRDSISTQVAQGPLETTRFPGRQRYTRSRVLRRLGFR